LFLGGEQTIMKDLATRQLLRQEFLNLRMRFCAPQGDVLEGSCNIKYGNMRTVVSLQAQGSDLMSMIVSY
jgi:hypothetical protein